MNEQDKPSINNSIVQPSGTVQPNSIVGESPQLDQKGRRGRLVPTVLVVLQTFIQVLWLVALQDSGRNVNLGSWLLFSLIVFGGWILGIVLILTHYSKAKSPVWYWIGFILTFSPYVFLVLVSLLVAVGVALNPPQASAPSFQQFDASQIAAKAPQAKSEVTASYQATSSPDTALVPLGTAYTDNCYQERATSFGGQDVKECIGELVAFYGSNSATPLPGAIATTSCSGTATMTDSKLTTFPNQYTIISLSPACQTAGVYNTLASAEYPNYGSYQGSSVNDSEFTNHYSTNSNQPLSADTLKAKISGKGYASIVVEQFEETYFSMSMP